jgi:hypothetical protein
MGGARHATKPVDLVVGLMHETLARNENSARNGSAMWYSAAS